ncbi:hypothetical protein K435DRAFT_397683 [Dendrothele bispora CBS 962.96]|uniref:Uncharacterized protein n=1 Tax=Dendrothele bispora (strain CBS 962.96) TaxID=1314807 RepID=A0A4S8L7Y7_DENBC|nr:hypothetical protein K435DRAFT_397683 [Dendrothele bispora CBS 962.96]
MMDHAQILTNGEYRPYVRRHIPLQIQLVAHHDTISLISLIKQAAIVLFRTLRTDSRGDFYSFFNR